MKTYDELMAMSVEEVDAHAQTLGGAAFICHAPITIAEHRECLAEMAKSDLSNRGVMDEIAHLRRMIAMLEAHEAP